MNSIFGFEPIIPKGMALLKTARGSIEAMIIKSILDDAGIPSLVRERGVGSSVKIITGDSNFGTDIFVKEEIYEVALALITPEEDADEESVDDLAALDGAEAEDVEAYGDAEDSEDTEDSEDAE